jgi:hypothetical protein
MHNSYRVESAFRDLMAGGWLQIVTAADTRGNRNHDQVTLPTIIRITVVSKTIMDVDEDR